MTDVKQFLMICYAFPPVGGAGVQRSVKFAKYVARYGWDPTVLTVLNPSVPVKDEDLVYDMPKDLKILRARTWEPSYGLKKQLIPSSSNKRRPFKAFLRSLVTQVLQPDAQVLWNRSAYRLACREMKRTQFSAIYVSGPPFSSFLLGAKLKRRFSIPLVLDFRDEWGISTQYLENSNKRSNVRTRQLRLFESMLQQADGIIATTLASVDELTRCCNKVGSSAIVRCIYNGFDPNDFDQLDRTRSESDWVRLVYTGTLWRLTDIEPFVRAVQQFAKRSPDEAKKLALYFVGRRTPEQDAALNQLASTQVQLQCLDYMSHKQSLQFACNADGLLLTLADQPGAERVVPGKLFEYMALQRPILSLVPTGEAERILAKHSLSTNIHPTQTDSIADWLRNFVQSKEERTEPKSLSDAFSDLDWCNRITLSGQLAEVLSKLT